MRRSRPKTSPEHARHAETLGLILIALLIVAVVLARYWHTISWGWR